MELTEIKLENLEPQSFIDQQCRAISAEVGDSIAINALSGGVDSAVTAVLVHEAIGNALTCIFVDNGVLREGEAKKVEETLRKNFHMKIRWENSLKLPVSNLK